MKRKTIPLTTTLKHNFVLAVVTSFVLLSAYSLDYAKPPCSALCERMNKALDEYNQQLIFLEEWNK